MSSLSDFNTQKRTHLTYTVEKTLSWFWSGSISACGTCGTYHRFINRRWFSSYWRPQLCNTIIILMFLLTFWQFLIKLPHTISNTITVLLRTSCYSLFKNGILRPSAAAALVCHFICCTKNLNFTIHSQLKDYQRLL